MITQVLSRLNMELLTFNTAVVLSTWVSALAGALITFLVRRDSAHPRTVRGFLRFCLPSTIWTHASPRMDVLFFILQRVVRVVLVLPFLATNVLVTLGTYRVLTYLFGVRAQNGESMGLWIFMFVVAIIVTDFATFYTHYLDHKFKLLWEFHKSHHAAEFLIPLTNRRFHPVQEIFDSNGVALCVGVTMGCLSYMLSLAVYDYSVIGVDVYFVANFLSFYHLRHSHIDMSYGPRFERWFLSPAQHQLHHSQEVVHWDKNFGLFLSVWDRMFGTLILAERFGTYRMGLPASSDNKFHNVFDLYLTPVRNVARMLWGAGGRLSGSATAIELPGSVGEQGSGIGA
jgi:sterol desaturase/sphingolipid hydroxylase (fatty acid hydroxylase superfamily)